MNASDKMEMARQSVSVLKPYLYGQSVAYLTSTQGSDIALNSGSLVAIGNRLFVATAAHTIPMNPGSEVWILSGTPRSSKEPYLSILKKNCIASERPDVGYLELDPKVALSYLGKEPCPIERVSTLGPGRASRPLMLVGNPGEYVPKDSNYTDSKGAVYPSIVPLMISFFTTPLMPNEWPSRAPDPDQATDIFLDYPTSDTQQIETGQPIALPNPEGMSGGGLWDLGFETDKLWVRENAVLFGIQSRWQEKLRYVRAVQIIHWLRLVHADYPDLRQSLEARFPELAP